MYFFIDDNKFKINKEKPSINRIFNVNSLIFLTHSSACYLIVERNGNLLAIDEAFLIPFVYLCSLFPLLFIEIHFDIIACAM